MPPLPAVTDMSSSQPLEGTQEKRVVSPNGTNGANGGDDADGTFLLDPFSALNLSNSPLSSPVNSQHSPISPTTKTVSNVHDPTEQDVVAGNGGASDAGDSDSVVDGSDDTSFVPRIGFGDDDDDDGGGETGDHSDHSDWDHHADIGVFVKCLDTGTVHKASHPETLDKRINSPKVRTAVLSDT